ncbi:Potassium channel [Pseudogymnoascus australis]
MNKYIPPHRPSQTYSQGFWDAIIGAVLYTIGSIILMVNILGFFLGHYPQYFNLTDEQCGMIIQTMMLCLWLSGGAGVFHKLCGWSYANALYFCDVTILTVGFGDFTPGTKAGRGLVFPYAAGGIIILGLLVSSIRRFVKDLGHEVVRGHMVRHLNDVKIPKTKQDRKDSHGVPAPAMTFGVSPITSMKNSSGADNRWGLSLSIGGDLVRSLEQRDRFDTLRAIQERTRQVTRYSALALSAIAFCIIWFIGALVFWRVELSQQHWSYSNALYFCYISLTTIGYGDFTPTSNSGKPFFIVWSLVAVPTMTILISNMGDTIIASYKRGALILAAWTILQEPGRRHRLWDRESWVVLGARGKYAHRAQKPGTKCTGARPGMDETGTASLQSPVTDGFDKHDLAVRLAMAIQKTSLDLEAVPPKRYNFDEWVEYNTLLRFTFNSEEEFQQEGVLEWVKLAECKESEWLLSRLTESLIRYLKTQRSDALKETRSKGLKDPIRRELNFESSHY